MNTLFDNLFDVLIQPAERHLDGVKKFLHDFEGDINAWISDYTTHTKCLYGCTLFSYLCSVTASHEAIHYLASHPDVDVDRCDYGGASPLIHAMIWHDYKTVYMLIEEFHANVNLGYTPSHGTMLDMALENHEHDLAKLLLRKKANPNGDPRSEFCPLYEAVESNCYKCCSMLLDYQAEMGNGMDKLSPLRRVRKLHKEGTELRDLFERHLELSQQGLRTLPLHDDELIAQFMRPIEASPHSPLFETMVPEPDESYIRNYTLLPPSPSSSKNDHDEDNLSLNRMKREIMMDIDAPPHSPKKFKS